MIMGKYFQQKAMTRAGTCHAEIATDPLAVLLAVGARFVVHSPNVQKEIATDVTES